MQERELQRADSAPVELSGAELISGCRAGQPEMLAELVKRYQPAVLRDLEGLSYEDIAKICRIDAKREKFRQPLMPFGRMLPPRHEPFEGDSTMKP